jgi:hypothetical protein
MFNKTKRVLKMLLCFTKGTVGYEKDTETNVKVSFLFSYDMKYDEEFYFIIIDS